MSAVGWECYERDGLEFGYSGRQNCEVQFCKLKRKSIHLKQYFYPVNRKNDQSQKWLTGADPAFMQLAAATVYRFNMVQPSTQRCCNMLKPSTKRAKAPPVQRSLPGCCFAAAGDVKQRLGTPSWLEVLGRSADWFIPRLMTSTHLRPAKGSSTLWLVSSRLWVSWLVKLHTFQHSLFGQPGSFLQENTCLQEWMFQCLQSDNTQPIIMR